MRTVTCLNCHVKVKKADAISWKKVHFCSLKCLVDYYKSHHCEVCGKVLMRHMAMVETCGKMFCDTECAGKYIWRIIKKSFNDEPKKMQGGSAK